MKGASLSPIHHPLLQLLHEPRRGIAGALGEILPLAGADDRAGDIEERDAAVIGAGGSRGIATLRSKSRNEKRYLPPYMSAHFAELGGMRGAHDESKASG